MQQLLEQLKRRERLSSEEYFYLLSNYDSSTLATANAMAKEVSQKQFGREIYLRGLIEISNYCHNNCYYCGIRAGNSTIERYRLSKEEIMECCLQGQALGFKTVVLQGGEDTRQTDTWITEVVTEIRKNFPELAITLSLGEHSAEAYQAFFQAGANRYLLRHETFNRSHYEKMHPSIMSYEHRIECLRTLKHIGFQTGTGMMVGAPFQTLENLVEDILFIQELEPQMIGIGPFLPQKDTPFGTYAKGSMELTLLLISIFRLLFPQALIPATTSLSTIAPNGREKGILAGANVLMPNLSPLEQRKKYMLYDNKVSLGAESAQAINELSLRLERIGYTISNQRGDYQKL